MFETVFYQELTFQSSFQVKMKLQLAIVAVTAFLLEASVAKSITETIQVENGTITKSSFEDGPFGG